MYFNNIELLLLIFKFGSSKNKGYNIFVNISNFDRTFMVIVLGRRKESIAKVKLVSGSGKIVINQSESKFYTQYHPVYRSRVLNPLEGLGLRRSYDVIINVHGGGVKGQAEAIQLGIARAICLLDHSHRNSLKLRGYLTRNSRSKERRKYGLKKARKASQFSKR